MDTTINIVKDYIRKLFCNESTGHDYYHAIRVESTANKICDIEGGNRLVVRLASLLHDVIDDKIQDSLNKKYEKFETFFEKLDISDVDKENILYIMNNMSFSKMLESGSGANNMLELAIVSDADKIDSVGAIGIARTFAYGGRVGNKIYDPEIKPELNLTREEYKRKGRITTTLNHFDEKLLQIDKYIITETGKKIIRPRIDFIKMFKRQFINEWNSILEE